MMTLRLRQCGDPGVKPSRVRKFSMKPLLLRKKLIRTRYREHVSGGEWRRENCWLHFRIDDLRCPSESYILEPSFLCTDCANAVLRIGTSMFAMSVVFIMFASICGVVV
jgi:hypothetical protein